MSRSVFVVAAGACSASAILMLASAADYRRAAAALPGAWFFATSSVEGSRPPGWLDAADLTPAQVARTAELYRASESEHDHASRTGPGYFPLLGREDIELIRQDRRRAEAAHPDVAGDDLLEGRWASFGAASAIPMAYGGSNASGSKTRPGGSYVLDGQAFLGFVRPSFKERLGAGETAAFFSAAAGRRRCARLARTAFSFGVAEPPRYGEVVCSVAAGCRLRLVEPATGIAATWTFPFVPAEFASADAFRVAEVRAMPAFAGAVETRRISAPAKPSGSDRGTVAYSAGSGPGALPPGGTMTITSAIVMRPAVGDP